MLYQIGACQFAQNGLTPYEVSEDLAADFAEKDVVGVLKPAEPVGQGDDILKMTCRLFTRQQAAGLATIAQLDAMRLAQTPQICVRGDGLSYGWRRITQITKKNRFLDISGRPKVIDYEITLKLSPPPSPAARLAFLYNLLS